MPNAMNTSNVIAGTPAARRRWRDAPLVILKIDAPQSPHGYKLRIMALARTLEWRILDLLFHDGLLPRNILPQGAFVDRLPTDPVVREFRRRGCRLVRIGALPHPLDRTVPAVVEDQAAAGRLAAEHFAERRFRHVGFVGYKPLSNNLAMYRGFRERAVECGCTCHLLEFKELVGGEGELPKEEKIRLRLREFAEWIARVPKPVGVLTSNDVLAGRLCGAVLEAGLEIPDEVAMLGHGNEVPICESAPVPLSSIDFGDGHAEAAVRIMLDLLAGKPGPARAVRVPPRGIAVRASTDVQAVADPLVARALRHIWDHFDLDLSVDDVAREVGVSRRHLERAFRPLVGRGVSAELRRKRVTELSRLLLTTDRPFADLAPVAGFRTLAGAHKCFRQEYGTTPHKYRARERARERGMPDAS